MLKTKQDIITKIHLIILVLIVVPVAFIYGFNPSSEFDIHLNTVDEHNQFKAIMGLYLGFSVFWFLGIFDERSDRLWAHVCNLRDHAHSKLVCRWT